MTIKEISTLNVKQRKTQILNRYLQVIVISPLSFTKLHLTKGSTLNDLTNSVHNVRKTFFFCARVLGLTALNLIRILQC